jgi:inhibitor of cysteine peptidase
MASGAGVASADSCISKWILTCCIPAMVAVLMIAGCADSGGGAGDPSDTYGESQVATLDSAADLEAYLKEQYARSINVDLLAQSGALETDGGRSNDDAAGDGAESSVAYSGTNVQEAGVDEADVVKTDGRYLFIASGNGFQVVSLADGLTVVAAERVAGPVDALYLYDDKLVVLYGTVSGGGAPQPVIDFPAGRRLFGMPYWIPTEVKQGVAIFDVSDPSDPIPLKTTEFDGYLVSSRLVGGKLHLVQQFVPRLPPLDFWYDGSASDYETALAANRAAIAQMTLDQLIPYYQEVTANSETGQTLASGAPVVAPTDFYCPTSENGGGSITTVVTFDLDAATLPFTSTGIVADAHIVYASAESLYTASHRYFYDSEISEETTLYKFDLTGDEVRFVGGSVIPGWILNQFSLGEYQGVLRVATTTGHATGWGPQSRNQVYCLKSNGEELKVIGKIEDLAPGEQLYAARFMGARGFLVTFVSIDPLFALDLSDPTHPRVAGELKVPGYADYIHPFGEDYLITVGKDAQPAEEANMAWYQGVQLSIFDISDLSAPVLLHREILGDRGTSTEVAYNHKAFTFWPERALLALPIDLHEYSQPPEYPWSYAERTFNGLYVYHLSDQTGFERLGRIDTQTDAGDAAATVLWTRGLFVEEQVLAVTPGSVRSASLDDIAAGAATLNLEPL